MTAGKRRQSMNTTLVGSTEKLKKRNMSKKKFKSILGDISLVNDLSVVKLDQTIEVPDEFVIFDDES